MRHCIPAILLLLATSISCARDPEIARREYLASGDALLGQQKVKHAIVQYRKALTQDPQSAEVRSRLANAYRQNGELEQAAREYAWTANHLPKDIQAQLQAGDFLLFVGRFDEAGARAATALELDAGNVEALVLRGNALAGLKHLEDAIDDIQEAITLDPAAPHAHLSLAAIERAASRSTEAEAAFRKAIEANPKSVDAQLALVNFYWAMRMTSETEQTLRHVSMLAPDHPLVNRMLALFRIANGKPEDAEPYLKQYAQTLKDTDSKLVLADYYLDRGRSKDALPLLHELASDTSAQRAIELRLARLDIQEGRRREARGRLNTLFRLDSQDPSTLILEGQLLSAEQKIAQAIVTLRGAVRISPQSAKSEFDLGRAYLAKNDPEEAIKAFTETLRLNPMAAAAELELSRLELTRERPENTVQSVKSSGGKVKRNPTVELTRVRALVAKGDLQQADDEIQVLLAKYPDYVSLFMQAGIVADLKGDRERAARWFSNALGLYDGYQEAFSALIALDLSYKDPATAIARVEGRLKGSPNNTEMLLLAARVYESVGNLGKSEQVLQRTIEIDASKLQAYEMLARQYRSQKRTDEALKQLDERSKQEPPTVQAHTLAAMLLEAQHRTREARKRYELALTLDPKAAVAATRLAWIYAETGGNLDTALQLARTAARGLPDSAPVEDTLGWIYYKKGLAALAIPSFQKSVDQDPANPVYASHLALAQAKMDGKY